jgi:hypothetical protein
MTTPVLRDIFRKYNDNGDTVSTNHLADLLVDVGISNIVFDTDAVVSLIKLMDPKKSGTIEFHDFCEWWKKLDERKIHAIKYINKEMRRFGMEGSLTREHVKELFGEEELKKFEKYMHGNRIAFGDLATSLSDEIITRVWTESYVTMNAALQLERALLNSTAKNAEQEHLTMQKLGSIETHQETFVQIFDHIYKQMNSHADELNLTKADVEKLKESLDDMKGQSDLAEQLQEMKIASKIDTINARIEFEASQIHELQHNNSGHAKLLSKLANDVQNMKSETKEPVAGSLDSNAEQRISVLEERAAKLEKDLQVAIQIAEDDNAVTNNVLKENNLKNEVSMIQHLNQHELSILKKCGQKIEEEKHATQMALEDVLEKYEELEEKYVRQNAIIERLLAAESSKATVQEIEEKLTSRLREQEERLLQAGATEEELERISQEKKHRDEVIEHMAREKMYLADQVEKIKAEQKIMQEELDHLRAKNQTRDESEKRTSDRIDMMEQALREDIRSDMETIRDKLEARATKQQELEEKVTKQERALGDLSGKDESVEKVIHDRIEEATRRIENEINEQAKRQAEQLEKVQSHLVERVNEVQNHVEDSTDTKLKQVCDDVDDKLLRSHGELQVVRNDIGDRIEQAELSQRALYTTVNQELARLNEQLSVVRQDTNSLNELEAKIQDQLRNQKTSVESLQKNFDESVRKMVDSLRAQQGANSTKFSEVGEQLKQVKDDMIAYIEANNNSLREQANGAAKAVEDEAEKIHEMRVKLAASFDGVEAARKKIKKAERERTQILADLEDMKNNCHCEAADYENLKLKEKLETLTKEMGVMRELLKIHMGDTKDTIEKHKSLTSATKHLKKRPTAPQTETLKLVGCKWRTEVPDTFRVSEDGTTVRCVENRNDFVLVGTVCAPSHVLSFWEIELRPKGTTDLAYVGIIPDIDDSTRAKLSSGWFLRSDGVLVDQGRQVTVPKRYCDQFTGKEVSIGVLLDLTKGSLVFFLDGKPFSVAFKDISGRVRPAVAVYGKTSLTANFNSTVRLT